MPEIGDTTEAVRGTLASAQNERGELAIVLVSDDGRGNTQVHPIHPAHERELNPSSLMIDGLGARAVILPPSYCPVYARDRAGQLTDVYGQPVVLHTASGDVRGSICLGWTPDGTLRPMLEPEDGSQHVLLNPVTIGGPLRRGEAPRMLHLLPAAAVS